MLPLLASPPPLGMAASFLLLCVARSSAAPALLGAALTRQSSLLQTILADASATLVAVSAESVTASSSDEGAIVAALVQMLSHPAVSVRALQCGVLLLRALHVSPKSLPIAPYTAAAAPLAALLAASPAAALESFERGLSSYRQLNFARLANEPALLLLPPRPGADEVADEAVHRFLALRDLWTGQRDVLLPLSPAAVPLLAPGAVTTIPATHVWTNGRHVLAVHETHIELLETSLDDDDELVGVESKASGLPRTARAIASMPVQRTDVQFVHENNSSSHSLPSCTLRFAAPDFPPQEMVLLTPELAAQARETIVAKRNAVIDSKIRQLSVLFSDVPE